ncbi:MAG: hypothetical protein ACXV2D_07890 [Halobacteriota archaeon]
MVNGEMRFSTSFTKRDPPSTDYYKLVRQNQQKPAPLLPWPYALLIYRVARTARLFVLELENAMEGSVKR